MSKRNERKEAVFYLAILRREIDPQSLSVKQLDESGSAPDRYPAIQMGAEYGETGGEDGTEAEASDCPLDDRAVRTALHVLEQDVHADQVDVPATSGRGGEGVRQVTNERKKGGGGNESV